MSGILLPPVLPGNPKCAHGLMVEIFPVLKKAIQSFRFRLHFRHRVNRPKLEPPARKYALNFVFEVDNVLNHPNDGQPVGQVSSPEFGKSLSLNSAFIGSPNANRMIYSGTFFSF